MLRVENGILIIDNEDYSAVNVWGFTPNRDFTITVLEGQVFIEYPLDDYLSQGESYTMSVQTDDQTVWISSGGVNEARVKIEYVPTEVVNLYEQQAIVPAAVSSQLDVTGEERIHIAPYVEQEIPEVCAYMYVEYGYNGGDLVTLNSLANTENLPAWFEWGEPFAVTFTDQPGAVYEFNYDEEYDRYYAYRDNGSFWWPTPGLVTNGQISPVTEGGYSWSCLHVEEEPGV